MGAIVTATLKVIPGTTILINVGGIGGDRHATLASVITEAFGGFNGGGGADPMARFDLNGAGGGGASDIRLSSDLSSRWIVAAGGGGGSSSCYPSTGGNGGGKKDFF